MSAPVITLEICLPVGGTPADMQTMVRASADRAIVSGNGTAAAALLQLAGLVDVAIAFGASCQAVPA